MQFAELIPILQMAIAPMIIVSAVSLLILSLTNRYGRINDRARLIAHSLSSTTGAEHDRLAAQIPVLYRRAHLLRLAVAFAILSAILAAVLIIALFITAFFQSNFILPAVLIFIVCMISLIASLVVYLIEINHSLTAMQFEIFAKNPTQAPK